MSDFFVENRLELDYHGDMAKNPPLPKKPELMREPLTERNFHLDFLRVTEAAALAVLRGVYHGAVAGTATSDDVDFRTVAIIGLLRLIVTGALRPTVTASGRRPSIESGE